MNHQLALITVVYQNYDVLKDLFKSLKDQTNKNFHLFIADLSKEKKKIEGIQFPATIIEGTNKGYAYGVNLSLKEAEKRFDSFCVINNDTILANNFVESVLISIRKHPTSIIGGKIYYAPGYEYHKKKYAKKNLGHVLWYAGGTIDWKNAYIRHRLVDEVDTQKTSESETTDFISGCLMAFNKKVLEMLGYWDERYFLYYEDADYCERARKRGVKLIYDPSIVMWHKNAQSTEGSGSQLHRRYQEKNRLQFALKYAPLKTKLHMLKNYFFSL